MESENGIMSKLESVFLCLRKILKNSMFLQKIFFLTLLVTLYKTPLNNNLFSNLVTTIANICQCLKVVKFKQNRIVKSKK